MTASPERRDPRGRRLSNQARTGAPARTRFGSRIAATNATSATPRYGAQGRSNSPASRELFEAELPSIGSIPSPGEPESQTRESHRCLQRVAHGPGRIAQHRARTHERRHHESRPAETEPDKGSPGQKHGGGERHDVQGDDTRDSAQSEPGSGKERIEHGLRVRCRCAELLQNDRLATRLGRRIQPFEITLTEDEIAIERQALGHRQEGSLISAHHGRRATRRQ